MKMLLGRMVHFRKSVGGDNWILFQVRWNCKIAQVEYNEYLRMFVDFGVKDALYIDLSLVDAYIESMLGGLIGT
jgi:hypothetical protein